MANEIDVTEEAQKRLCRFSYLSHCTGTMEERLAVLKKNVSTLNDASEEVTVSFAEDDLWIKVGECFFHQEADSVQERLSAMQDEARAELRKLDCELTAYRSEMQDLKVKLYAEFGNRVNLDKGRFEQKPLKMGRAQQRKKKGKERLDRYYHLAKEQGFRARSAFKLIQLAQKYDLFTGCRVAVDLCAAPGGWMQVCARHMPLSSLVIGVDLAPIQPIKGCTSFQGNITTQECRAKIRKLLAGQEADLFLHDGSPNMGMDWSVDAFNQNVLVLHAAHLASEFLRKGGTFVSKVFRSSDYASLLYVLQQLFVRVEATKPQASRNVSAEIFVVCKGFKQPDRVDSRLFDPKFAFLSVDDGAEENIQQKQAGGGGTRIDGEEEGSAASVLPQKARVKLAEAFANAQKRRRGGYGSEETRYKVLTIGAFFTSASPVKSLLSASELVKSGDSNCDALEQAVLSHRLTTPEIRSLWGDLKVLGKRELSQLLKWRFKIKREIVLLQKQQHLTSPTAEASGEEQTDAAAEDEEEGVEQQIDEELETLHASVSRQALRQQRRAAKKQRLLQTKQQFSRNAFAASERDPDLFAFTKDAAAAFKKEHQTVDAQLLLTGGEVENEEQHDLNLPFADDGILSKPKFPKDDLVASEQDSDLDSVDRHVVDLEVGLRLRAMNEAARRGSKPQAKEHMTRRARMIEERIEELRTVTDQMQNRALAHLSEKRESEEQDESSDEEEVGENRKHPHTHKPAKDEGPHEYFDDELSETLKALKPAALKPSNSSSSGNSNSSSSSSGKGREAQAAARWFSQPLFSGAVDEVADALLAEEFDPVIQQQQQQQQGQQQVEEESGEEEMKELDDAELPQIPLSEKQKRQQQRRRKEQKKAAREAVRVGSLNAEEDAAVDEKSHRWVKAAKPQVCVCILLHAVLY
ncbi:hypothetical protein Esti_000030 [Eimeria stiedai]